MTDPASPYASETVTYVQHPAQVVKTAVINGTSVDVVRHLKIIQSNRAVEPAADVSYYQAALTGGYELIPATVTFWSNAGPNHQAGDRRYASATGLLGVGMSTSRVSLGTSATVEGAVAAARAVLNREALEVRYGPAAVANYRTIIQDDYNRLEPGAAIEPGDIVVGWGHGQWRQGVATKVTKASVYFLFTTPTGSPRLAHGVGKRGVVRLVSKPAREEPVADEIALGPAPAGGLSYDEVPQYPEGTPEHTAYSNELRGELRKWAAGEPPYPYPQESGES